jgi:diaminohydroxyphosphoribosylaminopyrimidine deaminase/5-amino-6-(5-phosphoribosylamino)uracil reductase
MMISTPFTQMLAHKLRADEDAILVGRVTDDRDHPQLNVRHWVGSDPKRLVIDHDHPVNLESLYHHGVQSLIVEGGTRTIQSFLVQDLWDEIRVETNSCLTAPGGTRAPQLPANCTAVSSLLWDSNLIVTYRRTS